MSIAGPAVPLQWTFHSLIIAQLFRSHPRSFVTPFRVHLDCVLHPHRTIEQQQREPSPRASDTTLLSSAKDPQRLYLKKINKNVFVRYAGGSEQGYGLLEKIAE